MTNAPMPPWKTARRKVTSSLAITDFTTTGYLNMELLRFTTAGSVDDGKSTLIGRLLYDSKSIFADQYEAIEKSSVLRGEDYVNLALLTDGLRAEREQGITIDVAYRYFATPKRKFIIADTPGHIEYTRNMVTGASTANLAVILVDARKGVVEQTSRHAIIASILQIPHVVVCINKMDLVDYDEAVFQSIRHDFEAMASHLSQVDLHFIPISALNGDNVVERSTHMDWYAGEPLLTLLETMFIASDENHIDRRFPVQYVVRPQSAEYHDYRGYAGRIAGGVFKPGDNVVVLPSGRSTKIRSIETFDGQLEEAFAPMSVSLTLEDQVDASRGDMIAGEHDRPIIGQDIELIVCWMDSKKLAVGGRYALKHTTRDTRCVVREVQYKININTMEHNEADTEIGMNDIGKIKIRTTTPLAYDSYQRNRNTGSLILIDEATHITVGAGMIV
jgi:sulfate adenylyltransferase subunit 1